MPKTFQQCLENAQDFIKDEGASLKLAGQFLEQHFAQVLLNERAKAAEERAKAAEERAKAAIAEERAKAAIAEERAKAAIAEQEAKTAIAEQEAKSANQMLQVKEDFYLKYEAERSTLIKNLNMDRLRARGLLSSRGVYEWYLKLVYNEHKPFFGKTFFASTVCEKLGNLTSGSKTAALQDVIKICLRDSGPNAPNDPSNDEVSIYARSLYGTLSNQIHGSPWEADFVELSDQLNILDRCVVMGLCKDFGLL